MQTSPGNAQQYPLVPLCRNVKSFPAFLSILGFGSDPSPAMLIPSALPPLLRSLCCRIKHSLFRPHSIFPASPMFAAATPPPPLHLLSRFFIISHVYHSPTHFSSPPPPTVHPPPSGTLLFQETGLIARYWNCSAVQTLGGKQDCSPPSISPKQHISFPATLLSSHSILALSLPLSLYFLSKANTIIHRELSLYSCIKWNVFMLTRSFTCTLQSPNIPTWVCTEWIPLSPIFPAFVPLCPPASVRRAACSPPVGVMHESRFERTEKATPRPPPLRWAWVLTNSSSETRSFHIRSHDWALNIHEVEAINIAAPHATPPVCPQIPALRSKRTGRLGCSAATQ